MSILNKRDISMLVFGILFSLLFAEVLLRIIWKPVFLDSKYQRDDFTWISENVILNRFGYRNKEVDVKKEEGVYRIYSLGDSYTYGWQIKNILTSVDLYNLSARNMSFSELEARGLIKIFEKN